MSSKKVLGRGLSAIIEDVEEAYKQDIEQAKDLVREIDIERIPPTLISHAFILMRLRFAN